MGDSLDMTAGGVKSVFIAEPVGAPAFPAGYYHDVGDAVSMGPHEFREPLLTPDVDAAAFNYFEAQIHGGLGVADVDSVYFTGSPPHELQESLATRGIRWAVRPE
jgi:hypothetical protein